MQEESKNKTDSQFLKTAVMRTVLQVGNIVKTDTEELTQKSIKPVAERSEGVGVKVKYSSIALQAIS